MGTIASQITSLTTVYSTVYSDADRRKYQSSASLAFVRGIHLRPVNSRHKWPATRKMFPFDDAIMMTKDTWKHVFVYHLSYKQRHLWSIDRYVILINWLSTEHLNTCLFPTLGKNTIDASNLLIRIRLEGTCISLRTPNRSNLTIARHKTWHRILRILTSRAGVWGGVGWGFKNTYELLNRGALVHCQPCMNFSYFKVWARYFGINIFD